MEPLHVQPRRDQVKKRSWWLNPTVQLPVASPKFCLPRFYEVRGPAWRCMTLVLIPWPTWGASGMGQSISCPDWTPWNQASSKHRRRRGCVTVSNLLHSSDQLTRLRLRVDSASAAGRSNFRYLCRLPITMCHLRNLAPRHQHCCISCILSL